MEARVRNRVLAAALLGAGVVWAFTVLARATPRDRRPSCESPSLFVDKSERYLELRCEGTTPQRFRATFGANPSGPKRAEGDERTPEGNYRITSRVRPPRFHRFLGVSYPSQEDRAQSRALGVRRPGRGIGVHGVRRDLAGLARIWLRAAPSSVPWGPTDGCIALANEDVEIVYDAVRVGSPITIVP